MGAGKALSYEEMRQKKLEENKRKLEELNLSHLSLVLREATSPKTTPTKQTKRKVPQEGGLVAVRRSDRLANLPQQPTYREVASDIVERPRRSFKRRCLADRVYASDEARLYAQTKAEELESQLDPKFPTFVKPMLQSHVTGGFWLGLPRHFCTKHLPRKDTMMTLVDENGDEFKSLYLAPKNGLSGGWRGFSIYHELVDGDALIFQLIKPTTFKVYIIRASGYDQS
ncbi:B3 domain-containing protein Os06g0194400 isoform X1 [Elaeis guineensis]|uniref:B3 domain-containing protein Os06g0194400 isoform X1 n=1 Tax=Elaeis guineensis var. tenera TaxID=51953 RepID=A0A6I9R866_ELAGV|nr:B3 domain-containing protein Os06g0194400 isoform X1 [Elaeis guineensis]XP_010922412.1 B3 domain-containing protein Os06g0194400 isoform X1 [Elaeis guineensis]